MKYKKCGNNGWKLVDYSGEMVLAKYYNRQVLTDIGVDYFNRVLGPKIKRFNIDFQVDKDKDLSKVVLDDFAKLAINSFRIKWSVPQNRVKQENDESKYPFNPHSISLTDAGVYLAKKYAKIEEPKNRSYKRLMAAKMLYNECFEMMN